MKLKISIIIPVYNVEQYVANCLESVINQTYKNLEIIIVNDGATDNSPEICYDYSKKDSRIILINQENKGLSGARNTGMNAATGDYIAFIDSDDTMHENMLEIMLSTIIKYDLKIVECDFVKGGYDSNIEFHQNKVEVQDIEKALNRINKPGFYSTWTKLYRSDLLENLNFIPGKIHEDTLMTSQVYKRINHIGYIDIPLLIYTIDNESITRSRYSKKNVDAIDVVMEAHDNFIKLAQKKSTKKTIANTITKFLVHNYNSLFEYSNLDNNKVHRKKIRKYISSKSQLIDFNLYNFLIIYLPISFYNVFHKMNSKRIEKKLS